MTCSRCSRAFDLANLIGWTHRGRPGLMHPNYEAELSSLRAGGRLQLLGVGCRARVIAPDEHAGRVGRVVKLGRTSYHLRTGRTVLRVPFAWVEPA